MAADAKFIVLAEVTQPGKMYGRARAVEVIKGDAPSSDFVVTGFNNGCWPKPEQERQALRNNEQYLFFLQPTQTDLPVGTGFISWSACSGELAMPKAWRTLPRYAVPTPSMGDYRVERGNVYSDANFCSDCSDTLAAPRDTVLALLRGITQPNDPVAQDAVRDLLAHELTVELVRSARADERARVKLSWLLEAQAVVGGVSARDALLAAVDTDMPNIRVAGLRAMPSLGATSEVVNTLARLLLTQNVPEANALQVEATRALTLLDPSGKRAPALILSAILAADANESVARESAAIDLGSSTSARETMVRALTHYRTSQATSTLLTLLQRDDNASGALDALLDHFLQFPSPLARTELIRQYPTATEGKLARLNRFFIDDGDPAALNLVFDRMLRQSADLRDVYPMLAYYALHRPTGDFRLEQALWQCFAERPDDVELAALVPLAIAVQNPQLIHALLHLDLSQMTDGDPKTLERVARALQLKRTPPSSVEARMRAWLQLIVDDRWVGAATPYLLREFACSTPGALQPTLLAMLEREELSHLARRITVHSNVGKVDSVERNGLAFRCFPEDATASATVAQPLAPTEPAPLAVPRKAGCGAGCVIPSRGDRSRSMSAVLLLLLVLGGRRCGVNRRHQTDPWNPRTEQLPLDPGKIPKHRRLSREPCRRRGTHRARATQQHS